MTHSLTPALDSVHQSALFAASEFKKSEALLVDSLIEVERTSVHLKLGFSSMFNYGVESLRLSEAVSLNAIAVARKVREIPEIRNEVSEIGISKVRKIVSVLTRENQKEWIEKAKTSSSRALEKAVAQVNPRAATPERVKYVSEKRLDLRMGVSEEFMLKIRRAQDQASRSKGKPASLEDTFEEAIGFYLRHKDPLEKAKRVIAKKGQQEARATPTKAALSMGSVPSAKAAPPTHSTPGAKPTSPPHSTPAAKPTSSINKLFTGTVQRTPIPASTEHEVRLRDENQCQAKKFGGGICGEKRWIDFHHILPVSEGGTNVPSNLVTLCRAHHLEHHRGH